MRAYLLLIVLATYACAADPVGLWRFGVGSVDGQPARVGTIVHTGQLVSATDGAPLRLVCAEAPGITAVLAAGSAGRFLIETDAAGGRVLVLDLERGAVQIDITDRAPYTGVIARGAALQFRALGTLFVLERTRRDADFTALIRGRGVVGLRPEVARALGRAGELQLEERQGVSGDTTNGVGEPGALTSRPQVVGLGAPPSAQGDDGTGWDTDLGAELTGAFIDGGSLDDVAGGLPDGGSPFVDFAEDLIDTLGELGAPPQSTGDQIVDGGGTTPVGGTAALPAPPGPPSP